MLFTLLMAAVTLVSLVGLVVDPRIVAGSPIWLKPLKFGVSFALYGATLAWMLTHVTRFPRVARWAGTLIALGGTAEMAIVIGQVLRGTRSHFNQATPFDATLWRVMGITIAVVWLAHAVLSAVLAWTRFPDRALGLAIRLGLVLGLVGLALGALMTQRSTGVAGIVGAHTVGLPDGGPYLPVTGWSAAGGDLRVPHFVGIHALQVIPLATLLLGRHATRPLVWSLTASYAGLTALALWQALRGQPVFEPDATTMLAVLGLAVATTVAARLSVRVPAAARRVEEVAA
ncbi:hypothetical protein [Saccharothrix obliqua]|uniref:hypothetical protein n=1 Tax=Saccharothrix obliqua TaxID=2861747 RepID=UPI0027E24251|nr:hypothetical protein [Saccharothrix obliqua]